MSALREASQNVAASRNFKNRGQGMEDARSRRRETTVQLRKSNRDEQLMKRRNVREDDEEEDASQPPMDPRVALQNLPALCDSLFSQDPEIRFKSAQQIRKLLSRDRDPPIDTVIQAGAVPRMVQLLGDFQHPNVQFEVAWALTNVASGTSEQTATVLDHGAVQAFVGLLASPSEEVKDQSVWALGNIAGDSETFRDYVLKCGALLPVLNILSTGQASAALTRNAVWALSNMCRGKKPYPDFSIVRQALPTLARMLYSQDKEVLTDTCWALSYLSDGDDNKLQAVTEAGVVPRMVELLSYPSDEVKAPAVRVLGNIVTGNEMHTQLVLNAGVVPPLLQLLRTGKGTLKKEAAWTLSNIGAGSVNQIQALLNQDVAPALLHAMTKESDQRVVKEAAWAITNIVSGGTDEHIKLLVRQGVISPMVSMLQPSIEGKLLKIMLDGLQKVLKVGAVLSGGLENQYAMFVEEAGGLDRLEALQEHNNEEVYQKAFDIITRYFSDDADDDSENTAPVAGTTQYHFQPLNQPTNNGFSGFNF